MRTTSEEVAVGDGLVRGEADLLSVAAAGPRSFDLDEPAAEGHEAGLMATFPTFA